MSALAAAVPVRPRTSRALAWVIFVLALAGLTLSILTLISHYRTSATDYCDIGEAFNCDIVNRSIYSSIPVSTPWLNVKIPVAGIGIAGYGLLLALCHLIRKRWAMLIVFLGALAGFAFALRLTYIEKYWLATWCIMCVGSQIAIFLIAVLSGWQAVRALQGPRSG
jgi:uncharacterized membrane protein